VLNKVLLEILVLMKIKGTFSIEVIKIIYDMRKKYYVSINFIFRDRNWNSFY